MAEVTKNMILKIFPDFNINYYSYSPLNENTVRMYLTTQKQAFKFLEYIYDNSNIYLDRKYNNFVNIKQIYNNSND